LKNPAFCLPLENFVVNKGKLISSSMVRVQKKKIFMYGKFAMPLLMYGGITFTHLKENSSMVKLPYLC
jgi:hypothetical protein